MDVSEDQPQPPPRPARTRPAPPARRPQRGRPPGRKAAAGRRPPPSRGSRPGPGPSRPSASPEQRRLVVILSVLTVLVVVAAIGAFVLASGGDGETASGTAPSTTAPGTPTTLPASQLVTHRDEATGFSIKYPRTWQKANLPSPDGPVRLVLLAGGLNGVSVRVDRTEVPTTPENLANIKAVTDGIVGTNASAKVLQQREVTFNGMPGYYYLYTFTDAETGAEGAHGHYFLFKGRKMHSLVFQTIPATDFAGLAQVFDQVAETFQSDPDLAPAPTTTAAPATTVAPG